MGSDQTDPDRATELADQLEGVAHSAGPALDEDELRTLDQAAAHLRGDDG
jgi:hypothetical protein